MKGQGNMSLSEQVAIITGASSGIGQAVARDLATAGVKLVLTGRRGQRLSDLAAELRGSALLEADLTDPHVPQRLLELALEKFGRCDILFNNAGVMEAGTVEEIDIDRICRMVRINVEATYRMAYVALKHFRTQNRGHLLNVSSILGTKVRPTTGAYAGTKYAIEALSEALRMELAGSNVKVSCIEPGLVMTELHNHWPQHPTKILNVTDPLVPQDIARAVRFILEQPAHVRIPRMMVIPGQQQL
jgi:NADP-dependent 3-hydroxy acid dehydrogenase YdfG